MSIQGEGGWVQGSENILNYLKKEYFKYSSKPYEGVYIQIEGEYMGPASDGFAADYDGQISVTKIIKFSSLSDSECSP